MFVGKIYDLEVRTTDDPGWKVREAQKLAKLPLGEKGDNAIISYKYGIKLGYRAYFDLKTLGVSIKNIKITPKIYYVTKNGEIIEDVEYYYRTSVADYKKLETNDIEIRMSMLKTKGDVNNKDFKMELLSYLALPLIDAIDRDYSKEINIGGLSGEDSIVLDEDNSTLTKYNGKWYGESSRRWYGEIYMPASTIVAKKGTSITDIARGNNIYKDGYILITFNPIKATLKENEESYLKYSIAQNPDGTTIPPYVLLDEKENKDNVILPNGEEIKNLPETFEAEDAPIIIYDVSLRANDDYESSGTH